VKQGYYGAWGGRSSRKVAARDFSRAEVWFERVRSDPSFWAEYEALLGTYSCRRHR